MRFISIKKLRADRDRRIVLIGSEVNVDLLCVVGYEHIIEGLVILKTGRRKHRIELTVFKNRFTHFGLFISHGNNHLSRRYYHKEAGNESIRQYLLRSGGDPHGLLEYRRMAERDRALEVRQPLAGRGRSLDDAPDAVRLGCELLPHQALHILVFSFSSSLYLSPCSSPRSLLFFSRGEALMQPTPVASPGAKCRARQQKAGDEMDELKRLREAAGLSQVQLALRLGVSQSTVANWERGFRVPQAGNLIKLAKILGCGVDALLELNTQSADAARDNTIPDREVRVNG
nr:MAG TPA: helix-turn-helix domain protein [Caudoviricetes sp.]